MDSAKFEEHFPYKNESFEIIGICMNAHRFFADFVVLQKIILEIKVAENELANDQIAQTINYLKASGCKIGLLVNFGRLWLEYKRLIF